jgi:hypothetical protein
MHPFIITENIADRIQPTVSPAGTTGHEAKYLFDCKQNTDYQCSRTTGETITFTNATNDCYADTIVIYSNQAFSAATIDSTYNGGTTFVAQQVGLNLGMNVLKRATPVLMNQFTITITAQPNPNTYKIRHLWVGLAKNIDSPVYSLDPYMITQERIQIDNPDLGFFINQILSNKYNLNLSWNNVSDSSSSGFLTSTNLQDLINNCVAYGLPFWYFWNNLKTTEGYLVVAEDKNPSIPFQIGWIRSCSLSVKET